MAKKAKAEKLAAMTHSKTAGKKLVIVESPTKARTIKKFLGNTYMVESCMGHIRDLPESSKDIPEKFKKEKWSKLGVNVEKGFEPIYCIPSNKQKVVSTLRDRLKEASELILATDEDREGESISWHLTEVLKPKVQTKRMVFHEITKEAIEEALGNFREIDWNLVRAQEARRILDRLVGYTLSPLLWKKVAFGLSAGRVQSVAVRLIVEKELERLRFNKASYWGITAKLEKDGIEFEARCAAIKNVKVATGRDFDPQTGKLIDTEAAILLDEKKAKDLQKKVKSGTWEVARMEEKPVTRKALPPFITSTLQQEANRKLGLSSRETMQIAQKLYEQGYITYMRTDSMILSEQAIKASRKAIVDNYGKEYLSEQPRQFSGKKVKGAQEAHEAIRPAGTSFTLPNETGLNGVQLKLYDLIWKRTMASQMADAIQKQINVRIKAGDAVFAASGMTIEFPGFLRAYVEGHDDPEAGLQDREVRLPQLQIGNKVKCKDVQSDQHETKPPARYTEASLVQTMEREGIGRPSTYAVVIGTIIDRGYVKKMGNALSPTFTAMVVAKLLTRYLPQYVDIGFTSEMEKSLDNIADGDLDWQKYLQSIYFGKSGIKAQVEQQEKKIDPTEARSIHLEGLSGLDFRVGRFGAYVCTKKGKEEFSASLPENVAPGDMTKELALKLIEQKISGADALGVDPATKQKVYILNGRYGPYAQLGEIEGDDSKPKRMAIPPSINPEEITLKQALDLLALPKTLGVMPSTKKEIKAGLGRFGAYVVCEGDFRSIPKGESVLEISLKRAIELMSQPKRGRGSKAALKELGQHPELKMPVNIYNGPYGLYVKCGKVNVSLPEDMKPEAVTLKMALEWLEEKTGKKKPSGKKKSKAENKSTETRTTKSKTKMASVSQLPKVKSTAANVHAINNKKNAQKKSAKLVQ